ncbi:MAG TPA: MerR family transcriptional regulator [Planctomycetaceae bacterium]|jgi:DNA-binding transcriptional MerR regulator/effector-binding domain-containing protein|nr:MerR family transcriptional regulator [Planctomycetaceae bacterium]
MFTIGEFSKLSGLTVKTLRFYHEEGLLVPTFVDPDTSYRYYNESQIGTARVIAYLRSLEFPIGDIKQLLVTEDEHGLLDRLERQRSQIKEQIKRLQRTVRSLDQFIAEERQGQAMAQTLEGVTEKNVDALLVAGIRMKGRYNECGKGFGRLGRSFGRLICGKPLMLHYDSEYREDDADFEACLPIRQRKTVEGVSVRELHGVRCVALVHKGPYDLLGRSYAQVFKWIKERNCKVTLPTREVFLKGPGMIFRGNPKNYVTEIQIPIEA